MSRGQMDLRWAKYLGHIPFYVFFRLVHPDMQKVEDVFGPSKCI